MTILIFVGILLILIVGHEFGHFIAAKLAKMRVLEFGVGFPPRLWGKQIGDTLYSVNWLPFGGFVKIFGEDPNEGEIDPRAFSERSKLAQAAVLAAGPIMNFLLAFILFSAAFMVGVPATLDPAEAGGSGKVLVVEVVPGSPAEYAGIIPGDQILSAETPEEFSKMVQSAEGSVTVMIYHNSEQRTVTLTPVAGLLAEEPSRKAVGIVSALVGVVALAPLDALVAGFTETVRSTALVATGIFAFVGQTLSFSADFSGVSGPVGIISSVGDTAAYGVGALLSFAALISINLAIINFLPFPALDGGRIAFVAIEALIRRRIPHTVANGLNFAGFALLILLMLAVTVHDVSRLVG